MHSEYCVVAVGLFHVPNPSPFTTYLLYYPGIPQEREKLDEKLQGKGNDN